MKSKKVSVISEAKVSNILAQRGPEKASERPLRGGSIVTTSAAGGGPSGAARPRFLYYLLRTPARLKGVKKVIV